MQASIILTLLASLRLATALPVNSHDVITRGARAPALQAAPLVVRVDDDAKDSDDNSIEDTILMSLTSRGEDDDAEHGDDSATTMSLMNLTSREENDDAEDDSAAHTEVINLTH
ncbi:hypothetical protein M409DRAFT_48931 [Zasmidium cellare ATCC 36951]|uniref:Uncharacterized protein n=1 Tax=Zasmidium cellare ATCC 36951 TaxID=1080233 RepID=A0A6A6D4I9_ZASCE|nr:uncharacterized protein M409DRAFT_48931 [Zasmidium cellare ATCC 36951]KAF2174043.1 hypothetical protein M409DRAFT_48931 [Zasmidium cellare ATCC 36951]